MQGRLVALGVAGKRQLEAQPVIERQILNSKSGNGAQPSLESRIAAALHADASLSAADLGALIGEAEVAAAAAAATAIEERERALDIAIDPATAHQRVLVAELSRDRLKAVLPRLQQKLGEAQRREEAERWDAAYQRVAAKAEAAAERFARYPVLLAELLDLIQLAAQVDREASAVNSAAPGEHRRVRAVELMARGLKAFSINQPSITRDLKLPRWDNSALLAYPRHEPLDPSLYAPR
jgi:hypothetical protein